MDTLNKNKNNVKKYVNTASLEFLAPILFLLSLFLKPFYLFPSGGLQLSDICLALSFLFVIFIKKKSFKFFRIDAIYIIFLIFVALINFANYFYFVDSKYNDFTFVMSTVYYVFCFIAIFLFRDMGRDIEFIKKCVFVLRCALCIQLVVYVLHIGRYYATNYRYMGTFNDPNQFSVFILLAFSFIEIVIKKYNLRHFYLEDIATVVLIFEGASVGVVFALVAHYIFRLISFKFSFKISPGFILSILVGLTVVSGVLFYGNFDRNYSLEKITHDMSETVQKRFNEKTSENRSKLKVKKRNTTLIDNFIVDRNMEVAEQYPEFFLFGFGEGAYGRFPEKFIAGAAVGEIHCTPVALCYSYGIIPFAILVFWIILNFRHGTNKNRCLLMYIPVFIECLTLANQRQPLFWMLFVLAWFVVKDDEPEKGLKDAF